jgi:hypothetical protein
MLDQQLRDAWRAQERAVSISPVMRFVEDGLVLGAGTVLVARDGARRLQSLKGHEAELLALLSAAYGKSVAPAVLGNIERAAKYWGEGDICLAYIHLAHARLPELQDPREAARRLFIVDRFIKSGTSSRAIFEALGLGAAYIDAVEKLYNPDQPRVPAGSGITSGQWTSDAETGEATAAGGTGGDGAQGSSLLGRMPAPAASFLEDLDAAEVAELGTYALRILGPVGAAAAAFGLLFIPSPNDVRVEGEVADIPGLRYSWNRDETLLHLTYDDPDGGQRVFSAQLDGDVFRDVQGRVIGRVLSSGTVAIDAAVVSPDLVDKDEPRLCPLPVKDKRTNDLGLDYENYIKGIVNPGNPTPPYMGYMLSNIGKGPMFDDCEHSTGTLVEIKDGYTGFLASEWGRLFLAGLFVEQATAQVQAAGTRPVRWYFSQKQVADYAKEIFSKAPAGLQNVEIIYEPWPESGK